MIVFARNLVVKDFWLKLFSLALATLIWLTVWFSTHGETATSPWFALIGRPPDESVLTVPVHVPLGTSEPSEVSITLRGDPRILKTLKPQNIRAEVDMTGVQSANGLVRPVEIILPKGIFYTRIEPEEVAVQFSRKPE
jgi:hypothetical protein